MRFPRSTFFLPLAALALGALLPAARADTLVAAHPPVALPPLDPQNKWAKEMQAFDQADAQQPPPSAPIVFTGSSSIRRWGQELLTDYAGLSVLNRGFGGSQLSDLRDHFERTILRYQPRQVVIYSGGNDLHGGKTPQTVLADLQAIVDRIHRELPQTRVLFISIALNPNRWAERDRVREANRLIKELLARDPRDQYVDIIPAMTGPDGLPKPDIFVADRLHMNRKGYELWIPVIRPYLSPAVP